MYTKFHCSTNDFKHYSYSCTPLWHVLYIIFTSWPFSHSSVGYDWRVHIDDHLDDKVLLDLGVLQASLVSQQLPRKEPPLAGDVDFFLFLQLLL